MQDRCFAPFDWTDPPRTRSARLSLRGFLHNSRGGGGRKRRRGGGGKRRKKWMDLVLLFFCCESRRISPPHSWGRRWPSIFQKVFQPRVSTNAPPLILSTNTWRLNLAQPLSFRSCFFPRCWKNVATTPSSRLRDFQTITFPYMIAFYFLFIYFLFFYRGILLAEHIINWWVNQIVRMHALTPVYNYRN